MKNKIYKIMGVALALVLVFTLGVAFMPANTPAGPGEAEAGTLTWTGITVPSPTSNVLVANAEDLGPVAISPNFADDNTVFAVINESSKQPVVYFSTNGGHTWTKTTIPLGSDDDIGVALVVSPNFATDSTVFVATQDPENGGSGTGNVYRSVNGGASFGQLGEVALGVHEIITSMDVSPTYDGVGLLAIGVAHRHAGAVAASGHCLQVWGADQVLSWQGFTSSIEGNLDVSAVKFSPSFAMDSTILTVASASSQEPYLRPVVGGVWKSALATEVGAANVDDVDRNSGDISTYLMYADIAVPSDYNGTVPTLRRAYVTIVAESGVLADQSNVYRITGTTTGTEIATAMGEKLYPIDYSGTFAEGTLIGALFNITAGTQADVYRTTNPSDAVVHWYEVSGGANKPTGTTATVSGNTTCQAISGWVKMSTAFADDSTVIVGTQGIDSAFGISTDGAVSFNETGLIENADTALTYLMDVKLSPDFANDGTIFLTSDASTGSGLDTNVWVTKNGGAYWDRCFIADTDLPYGVIALSNEFATDSVVYVGDANATNIWYSATAGQKWSARACSIDIQTIAAPDATMVYVGERAGTGRVAKSTNSGWTWPSALRKATGCKDSVMSLKVDGETLLAGGNAGTVRRSDDGGTTWSKVDGTIVGGGNMYVAFDGTTVYTASSSGSLFRSVDGAGWTRLSLPPADGTAYRPKDAQGLILADDGTLYELDPSGYLGAAVTPSIAVGQTAMYRCINPTAPEPTPGITLENVAVWSTAASTDKAWDFDVAPAGSGNIIVMTGDLNAGVSANPEVLMTFTDTLSAGIDPPTLVAPADGSYLTTGLATRFTITSILNATAYEVRWSTDPDITSGVTIAAIAAPGTQTAVQTLPEGFTVYWKARATAPFNSPWSETWTVETELVTTVTAPLPAYPALDDVMNVPIEPIFNWGSFKYASGYEFQLAKDSGLTDFVVDLSGANALGNITSWKCTTTLAYDTTYYWRVRAIVGTSATYSDWSAIVGFTTMSKPVEPAPPVIIEPTPPAPPAPAPITPAYIYAIIAIGAVLVIVVIVLIVRTRRVP